MPRPTKLILDIRSGLPPRLAGHPQVRAEVAVDEISRGSEEGLIDGARLEIRRYGVFFARPLKQGRRAKSKDRRNHVDFRAGTAASGFKPGKDLLPYDRSPK
jgi:hypothetical protein